MRRPRASSALRPLWLPLLALGAIGVMPAAAQQAPPSPAAQQAPSPAAQQAPDAFDQAFDARGEPDWLHYQAEYQDARGSHQLEVWRDHDARIRRLTDGRVELLAVRHGDEVRFTVSDLQRNISTTVDRVNLVRLGLFVDWYSQGHAIARPAGAYTLVPLGETSQALDRSCAWWRLTPAPAAAATDICWDGGLKLPLMMRDAQGRVPWRLLAYEPAELPEAAFDGSDGGHDPRRTAIDMNAEFGADAD